MVLGAWNVPRFVPCIAAALHAGAEPRCMGARLAGRARVPDARRDRCRRSFSSHNTNTKLSVDITPESTLSFVGNNRWENGVVSWVKKPFWPPKIPQTGNFYLDVDSGVMSTDAQSKVTSYRMNENEELSNVRRKCLICRCRSFTIEITALFGNFKIIFRPPEVHENNLG